MMIKLEDITVGCSLTGLLVTESVTVIAVKWYGENVLEVAYKDSQGRLFSELLYREKERGLSLLDRDLPWSFDADGDLMRLVSEAYRVSLAHIFDPYLAIHTSAVEPLPHQISAVYQEMLPRLPLRYILADDPGAGKTIMTGLFLKEMIVRGDLKRCLIVSPGSLVEQWQDELYRKFNLPFAILTNDRIESAVTGNVFLETNCCIIRLDQLARNKSLQEKLKITDWDLIVVDEAHKMSATVWGGEARYTKRFQVGRLLSSITTNFLLLTATPHNGKEEDFQQAEKRADDLEARMYKRLTELEQEWQITAAPPAVIGGAAVIPRGLLDQLLRRPETFSADAAARRQIELAVMGAVMAIERSLGYQPTDVNAKKFGCDIESAIPKALRGPEDAPLFHRSQGQG